MNDRPVNPPKTLDQIAIECGTDKNSQCHAYTKYYEFFFEPIRFKELNVLEVGIYNGDSLRMWREYFPNAMIYGADIQDSSRYNEERIKTFICDQSSKTALMIARAQLPFMSLIVEDGSHQSKDQILTFEMLWSLLSPGGFYVIEDTLCDSFSQWNGGEPTPTLNRVRQMIGEVDMNGKVDQNFLCSNKRQEREKYQLTEFEHEIEFVFKSCGLVIIKKL